ncbi:HLA class II histocompatibility antigen, DQ beta 1 chain-like isoform X2 [Chiloscyllium punctatum]|uniref:HLA class II histocompatibility antigen, DQ beta 1 chain-like isoform X2 n=1 Tax=Chiloscyllium punctatum TaxID=137246 RepID=UPI003B63DCCB
MEWCIPRMLLILFSISWCFSRVSADRKIFTATFMAVSGTTDLPEYVGVGMINGVPVARYDSDTRQTVSLQQWMTDAYDANYWKTLTKQGDEHSDKARRDLRTVMKCTNQTSVQPEVFISRREPNGRDKPLTLSCLVTGFYPVDIEVTWLRNGEVMSGTYSSGVRPNHDGTHQIQKEIEINAGDEDQYSCQIEHSSLAEAQLYQWAIQEKNGEWSHLPIIFIIIGSVTGLAATFGIITWIRSYRAQPFLETRPTLRQQEILDKNVELKLMSKSEPQLKTQPLQRESKYPHGLEEGNKATNEEESPSETDKLNPASNVSD